MGESLPWRACKCFRESFFSGSIFHPLCAKSPSGILWVSLVTIVASLFWTFLFNWIIILCLYGVKGKIKRKRAQVFIYIRVHLCREWTFFYFKIIEEINDFVQCEIVKDWILTSHFHLPTFDQSKGTCILEVNYSDP